MVYTNEFRIARFFGMLVIIFLLGAFLPKLFWLLFEKPVKSPFVLYSPVKEKFFIKKIVPTGPVYLNSDGDTINIDQFQRGTPLFHFRKLIKDKNFPDSLQGQKLNTREVNINSFFKTTKPREVSGAYEKLYPLFESVVGEAPLEIPPDFFRLDEKIEFIDASTSHKIGSKSSFFQAALDEAGVRFPVKVIGGLPVIRKTQDDGYFFQDSANQLFQLKMVEGYPDITLVKNPGNIIFKYIECVDLRTHDWFAYLVSQTNQLYVLGQDYQLRELPVSEYLPEEEILRINGDFLYYTVVCEGENYLKAFSMDKDYHLVDTMDFSWETNMERWSGRTVSWLFPFTLSLTDNRSIWKKLRIKRTSQLGILAINFLFFLLHLILMKRKGIHLFALPEDCLLILITGVYGFLAFLLIPRTPLPYLKNSR